MKAAVITFPGSNCDRDMCVALEGAGAEVSKVWHKNNELPLNTDLVVVPGGFSFGDYLRSGAVAAQSPVARAIRDHAGRGGYVLGVCNGFQILTELNLLPGTLMRNSGLKFISKPVTLEVVNNDSIFTSEYKQNEKLDIPVAHHDGNYQLDEAGAVALEDKGQVAFRYALSINGSVNDIAGVLSENRRILGMMPHPERAVDTSHGGTDGMPMFAALIRGVVAA